MSLSSDRWLSHSCAKFYRSNSFIEIVIGCVVNPLLIKYRIINHSFQIAGHRARSTALSPGRDAGNACHIISARDQTEPNNASQCPRRAINDQPSKSTTLRPNQDILARPTNLDFQGSTLVYSSGDVVDLPLSMFPT